MTTPTFPLRQLSCTLALLATLATAPAAMAALYYPPPGESLAEQDQRTPEAVGLDATVIDDLTGKAGRWALWRHGYLVHVEGNFNETDEVKSVRKSWLAMAVGAGLAQGRLASLQEKVSALETDLTGNDVDATWAHLLSNSANFDVPLCPETAVPLPGEMWTYSDTTFLRLSNGLKKIYDAGPETTLRTAYFDAIGLQGWGFQQRPEDGIRLILDLEDMGRLGLLALGGGRWNGVQLVPDWFVRALTSKQARFMSADYESCPELDGVFPSELGLDSESFPEAPTGFLTWVNEDGDFVPGADTDWSSSLGSAGGPGFGFYLAWNPSNGLVFAGTEVDFTVTGNEILGILESKITGPNPLAPGEPPATSGCGDGVLDPGEACDDGNNAWRDGCRADCTLELCGDGALDVNEQCDDGNTANGDGCTSACLVGAGTPECDDGIDNDGDGVSDAEDPGCSGPDDVSERAPELPCDDGIDNDDDGRIDFDPITRADDPAFAAGSGDPGCNNPSWSLEDPQCQDGLDNDPGQDPTPDSRDFDGGASAGASGAAADEQCVGRPWRKTEASSSGSGCGLGAELVLLALPLAALRRARRRLGR